MCRNFNLKKCLFLLTLSVVVLLSFNNNYYVKAVQNNSNNCKSYILVEFDSQEVLSEKNADKKFPVASICKLMTSLIFLEHVESGNININDKTVASEYACSMEGSQAFLDANKEYKLYDIFKSVVVASANDSAVVIAEEIAGNEANFVKLMNDKAKMLKMNNTLYENSTGLPTFNQYSTARDTAILLKEISKFKLYNEFCNIWMDKLVHPSGRVTELVNTNRLIKYYDKCINGKTGFTDEAGYCLASSAKNDNMHLIAVVLGCNKIADRFVNCRELFEFGFKNYISEKILDEAMPIGKIQVVGSKVDYVNVYPENSYNNIYNKTNKNNIILNVNLPKTVKAPLFKNSVVGKIMVVKNNRVVKEINVVIKENCKKHNYNDCINKIIKNWQL